MVSSMLIDSVYEVAMSSNRDPIRSERRLDFCESITSPKPARIRFWGTRSRCASVWTVPDSCEFLGEV